MTGIGKISISFVSMVLLLCPPVGGFAQEVLRGEVAVELEPVQGFFIEGPYPLDADTARRRALEESALFYSAMIYGWSFDYEIGERARRIPEVFELAFLGRVEFGDPRLRATDAELRDMSFRLWTDYRLDAAQQRRMAMWKTGTIRSAQAIGRGPLGGPAAASDWLALKQAALEDAARAAVRSLLQGQERNRPKEARGYIALSSFPYYFLDAGEWAVSARFKIEVTEIVPFAAY